VITAILTSVIGFLVLRSAVKHRKDNLAIMAQYRLRHVLAAIAAAALIFTTVWGLLILFPVLVKNPVLWLASALFHWGSGNGGASLIFSGLQWKWYAVAFLPVLVLAVPRFAQAEEIQYRRGTTGWPQGIWRSTRFGMAHMIMLIPLAACIGLIWGGLLFTWVYFRGGTQSSTVYHAAFNTVMITVIFITILAS
jgi:magnesium-transporting ATPase (P-type)